MTPLVNTVTAVVPALCLLAYALLIGMGAQAALGARVRFAVSLGVVCGVGLSIIALVLCFAHVVLADVALPLIPLAILAMVAIAVRFARIRRDGTPDIPRILAGLLRTVTIFDVIAAVAATLVMLPLLRFGLSYWTTGTHDFPNYAASAQIWTTSAADFALKHPDAFGDYQLWRASFEKPMVTAYLVAMSKLSATPAFQLLAPMMLAFIYVSLACLLKLGSHVFKLGTFTTVVATFPASLALAPMSRVYDAQPGQIIAVALVMCLFAVLAVVALPKTLRSALPLAGVAALVWTASIGSNSTLVVGSGPMLAALLVWILSQERAEFGQRLKVAGLALLAVAGLSLPFAAMYLKSASFQTTGVHGFDVPLVSPIAVIGMQDSLFKTVTTVQALISWTVLLLFLLAVLWVRAASDRRRAIFDLVLLVSVFANAVVIGTRLGWENYGVHKWVALAIATTVPLVSSYWVSQLKDRARLAATVLLAVLVASSTLISLKRGVQTGFVASSDLMALHESARLAEEDQLNLRLRAGMSENMFAAITVPSGVVVLTERTYANATPPIGNRFLVKVDQLDRAPYSDVTRLNDTYALASLDLTLGARSIDFTTEHPETARLLFAGWYPSEAGGTWSGLSDNLLVFDLPTDLRGRDLRITITGNAFANAEASQSIKVQVNGKPTLELRYPDDEGKTIELTVSAETSEAAGGRVAINFYAPRPLSPSDFGSIDKRSLGFMLAGMTITPL